MDMIMLPRLGTHLSRWGSGHWCSSPPHDGPCTCQGCGVAQPYDSPACSVPGWSYAKVKNAGD